MKAVIVGAGAIGVWMGERLAASGWAVSALARGATLEALQAHGLRVIEKDETRQAPVIASDDPAALGPQDYLIISLKAQALPGLAASLAPLLGPDTAVVSAMNGIPWWFFHGLEGPLKDARLDSVDPAGAISKAIAPGRVIGCVLHNSNSTPEPGVARVVGLERLIFGEPDGSQSPRLLALADAFRRAGVKIDTPRDIRTPIWAKLWGNMYANPISALTGAGSSDMLNDEGVRTLILRMMQEMADIGARLGIDLGMTPDERMAVARRLGNFRTSMLQDMEAGRPIELDPILGAVVEVGQKLHRPVESLATVHALTRLSARMKGLYPA